MRGCISHGNPQTYVLQHRDVVAPVSESHGVLQVDVVESQHLVNTVTFAVAPGNDVGKKRMPAHRFTVREYAAEDFLVFLLREVAHDLQDFLVSGCFNGEDFRNADVDESGNFTDRLIFVGQEPGIVVHKDERHFRMSVLVADEALDVFLRYTAFVDVLSVGSETVGSVQGDVSVEVEVAHGFHH